MSTIDPYAGERPADRTIVFIKRGLIALALLAVGFFGWTGLKLWRSWQGLERVPWDLEATRARLQELPEAPAGEEPSPAMVVRGRPVDDESFSSFLVVGSDARAGFGGARADVIMLFLFPEGEIPALVSIPRDLYLPSPCGGAYMRINANFNGCGEEATGPELLGLAIEAYTGIEVDHFALFEFDGFRRIIDEVGGVTICVENPVRDFDAQLQLPAGCTRATGDQALGWVRSRKAQELVNGRWRLIPGQSDFTRQLHQQDVIFQLFDRLKEFDSLGELTDKVDSLSDAFTVDENLSLPSALRLVWRMRNLGADDFARLQIPVSDYTTPSGAQVLRPELAFSDLLSDVYSSDPSSEAG